MTTAGLRRALTATEKIYAAKEIFVGYTVRTAGRLEPAALATAYEAVRRAYPHLAARLETSDDGLVLTESEALPEVQLCDGNPEHPLTAVELDQHRALSALHVVRDGDDASVTLVNHHSVADAHHSLDVLATLWSCYTDAVHGVPVDLPRRPYPRPLEDLLAERGVQGIAPVDDAASRSVGRPVSELDTLVRHVAQCRLTAAQTTALAEVGHRENVTINGLLSGAILLVEAELRDLPLTDIVYRFTVNLRHRLSPPVGPTEGTNVLGGGRFAVTDGIEPSAVAIGRAVSAHLRAGLADGSLQRSLVDMAHIVTMAQLQAPIATPQGPGPAVTSMTNWGPVPPMRTPHDLLLTNFQSASHIRVVPGETANVGGYVVSTFGGRLAVDLAWPEANSEQSNRLDRLRERLNRLMRQS